MTYASLEEAYGGVSGSNFLSIPAKLSPPQARAAKRAHQRKENFTAQNPYVPPQRHDPLQVPKGKPYIPMYGGTRASEVLKRNNRFNAEQYATAVGIPQCPSSMPDCGLVAPQYPWVNRSDYLNFPSARGSDFYNSMDMYYPWLARQMEEYYRKHGYRGVSPPAHPFATAYPRLTTVPPPPPFSDTQRYPSFPYNQAPQIEYFTAPSSAPYGSRPPPRNMTPRNCLCAFIIFLIALAVVLCITMMFMNDS